MKPILLVAATAGAIVLLGGCASAPPTAWGKANVSKVDYGTDIGMCTGLAAMQGAGNGANTAGGIHGRNASAPATNQGDAARTAGRSGSNTGVIPSSGGGMYRDSAPQDVVQRAATQQQTQEMAVKRARADAFKSCITERGYQQFVLSAEQRQQLAKLTPG